MNAKARRNLQVREAYLWLIISLRRIAADQRWIFPPDALYNPNHPKALTLHSLGGKEVGLSPRGERILSSWNRKGLHTRWGCFCNGYPTLKINPDYRGYTTPEHYEQEKALLIECCGEKEDLYLYRGQRNEG